MTAQDQFDGVMGAGRGAEHPAPEKTVTVKAANGKTFTFRVAYVGDSWGRDRGLTVAAGERPLVEVYDADYKRPGFEPEGQIVCQYDLHTVARHPDGKGLNLHDGVPDWTVDADSMVKVVELARAHMEHLRLVFEADPFGDILRGA